MNKSINHLDAAHTFYVLNFAAESSGAFRNALRCVVEAYIEHLIKCGKRKVLFWGAGGHTRILFETVSFKNLEIIGVGDGHKQGRFGDYKILTKKEALSKKPDVVIISSRLMQEEIYKDLRPLFPAETELFKIYDLNNIKFIAEKSLPAVPLPEIINSESINSNTILFISDTPPFHLVRQSIALRKRNIKTCLILLEKYPDEIDSFLKRNFNCYINLYQLVDEYTVFEIVKAICDRVTPYLFHVWGLWSVLYLPLFVKRFSKVPVICDFNDIFSMFMNVKDFSESIGPNYGYLVNKLEKETVKKLDGLIHKEGELASTYLKDNYQRSNLVLNFKNYPSIEFQSFQDTPQPDQNTGVRVIYTGAMAPPIAKKVNLNANLLDTFKAITAQGIKIDAFLTPYSNPHPADFKDYRNLAGDNKLFKLFDGLPSDKINKIAGEYHYGLCGMFINDDTLINSQLYKSIFSTKLFTYLEAGIPIIINQAFSAMASYINIHKIGLVIPESYFWSGLADFLASINYTELKQNVLTYCREFAMENKIDQMISFYHSVTNNFIQEQHANHP